MRGHTVLCPRLVAALLAAACSMQACSQGTRLQAVIGCSLADRVCTCAAIACAAQRCAMGHLLPCLFRAWWGADSEGRQGPARLFHCTLYIKTPPYREEHWLPHMLRTVVTRCLTCCLLPAGGGGGADLLGQESAGGAGAGAAAPPSSHVDLLSQLEAPSPAAAPAQAAAASSPGQHRPCAARRAEAPAQAACVDGCSSDRLLRHCGVRLGVDVASAG